MAGNTLLSGVFGESVGVRLINLNGEVIREWMPNVDHLLSGLEHIRGVDLPFNGLFLNICPRGLSAVDGNCCAGNISGLGRR